MSKTGCSAALVGAFLALACWAAPDQASAVATSATLSVEYRDHALSVEAQGVPLADVLSRIGKNVGFTVVDSGVAPTPVSVSIQSASVEDVLRQLLRGENHTVIYRDGEGSAIETIVLLGAPGQAKHPETPGAVQERPAEPAADNPVSRSPQPQGTPAPPPAPREAEGVPGAPGERFTLADLPADPAGPMTVQDMLKAHALSALPSIH